MSGSDKPMLLQHLGQIYLNWKMRMDGWIAINDAIISLRILAATKT
jgi:hypothetical protein